MTFKAKASDDEARDDAQLTTLLDVDDVATLLGVSPGTIYNWVCRRRIAFLKIGRLVRFDPKEISDYMARCRINPLAGKG